MIDLHLHFDGSLLPRTILELAREQGISLPAEDPDELKLFLTAPEECESLNEYLEKFDLPLSVLQTREAVRKGMYTLLCSLKEQGLLYAEVRFAPQLHVHKGLSQEDVVRAAVLVCEAEITRRRTRKPLKQPVLTWDAVWRRLIWLALRLCIRRKILRTCLSMQGDWGCPSPFTLGRQTDRRVLRRPCVLGRPASAMEFGPKRMRSFLRF